MADFDQLSIRIEASARGAINQVNKLADALKDLNAQLAATNPSNVTAMANAMQTMSSLASTMRSSGVSRTVNAVANGIARVGQSAGNVAQVTSATQSMANAAQNAQSSMGAVATVTTNAGNASNTASNGMNRMANATNNTGNALRRVAPSAERASRSIRNLGGSSRSASLTSRGLVKELSRVGKMLKLMVTRMVLRKVIQGVIDGFKNLVQYSKVFDANISLLWNSLRQLGNSIAAAVSPLLNALAPALNYVIQLIIKAINVINQLISALTGMATWTRAKVLTDDYAKSLDKATGSAKELKKTVLGFDELNQLQDNKGGGGGGTSAKDMFEDVAIDPRILGIIDAIKKKVQELLAYLKKLWASFKDGFKNALGGDWKSKIASIIDGAKRIGNAINDILNDPKVSKARDRFMDSFSRMLGTLAGTVTQIGLNIGVNLTQGIAKSLEEKSPEIKDHLVEMFDLGTRANEQVEDFSLAIGKISDILTGDNAISATTGLSNVFLESFMLIRENAARLGVEILDLLTQPIIDNQDQISMTFDRMFGQAAGFLDTIDGALQDIRATLSSVWNESLSPMFDDIKSGLSDLTGEVMDFWNTYISPVIDDISAGLSELWQTDLQPLFDDLVHVLGIVGEYLAKVWKNNLVPLFSFLKGVFGPQIRAGLTLLWNSVEFVFKSISLVVGTITSVLRALLTFIKTGFTQGWSTAWKNLGKDFAQIWENMKAKMTSIINVMIDSINALLGAITGLIDNVSKKINELTGTHIPMLAEKIKIGSWQPFGFATGGFPEDGLFMANHNELVGRFANGKTAVANNEQITAGIAQAVYSAMMASNGGSAQYINNTIEVDGVAIARAVTKGQRSLDRRYSPTMA